MRNRSLVFRLSAALGSCLILLACLALVGLAGYYFLSQGNSIAGLQQASLFNLLAPGATNRIVYVGSDANIYAIDPSGAHKAQLTKDGDGGNTFGYDYPTWAPDNLHIAFVGVHFDQGTPTEATLYNADATGQKQQPLFKSDQFFPFYLYWSPDSHYITFLTAKDQNNLSLRVTNSDQQDSMQELDSGSPLYFAWSPDSRRMLLHIGGTRADSASARLSLLPFGQKNSAQSIPSSPGAFAAPQWSPDGQHVLFSRDNGNNQQTALIAGAQGDNAKSLLDYQGRIAFSWAPTGDRIAYIVTDAQLSLPNFGDVQVVDVNGQNKQDVSNEHALAFFWSPNGKRLAYLTVQLPNQPNGGTSHRVAGLAALQTPTIKLQWKVKDFDTGKLTTLITFEPTDNFVNMIAYFDQYARSTTFWSPDSQSFVYSGADSSGTDAIWVADVSGKAQPRKIADGEIAYWSWR